MIRKVIDSNCCADPLLESFLAASENNIAVLCEYTGIEAYNSQDPVDGMYKTLSILKNYPNQVMVLKGVRVISGQKRKVSGYLSRMVHDAQSRNFKQFCDLVDLAQSGSPNHIQIILELAMHAKDEADRALAEVEGYLAAAEEQMQIFPSQELKQLKELDRINDKLFEKIAALAVQINQLHLEERGINISGITPEEIIQSLSFRQVLSMVLRTIRWHANGSRPTNTQRVRNHIYDCGIAAYSSLFDGLISNDTDAKQTHKDILKFVERMS